jgi:hypothetical protein
MWTSEEDSKPGREAGSEPEKAPKARAARRRPGRKGPGFAAGPGMRDLVQQRDCLYEEARRNPDSEAGDLARTFLLSGMLAGRRADGGAASASSPERTAELERTVREQSAALEEVAQAAEQAKAMNWDAKTICGRIADLVGLRPPPSQMYLENPPYRGPEGEQLEQKEDTCQAPMVPTLKQY